MKWIKSPPALMAVFEVAVARFENAEKKKMFGYPCIFINGHLTAGLFQDRIMLRLSEKDRERFLKGEGHRVFEPMPGRPMKGYVEAPSTLIKDPKKLSAWLEKSVTHAGTLKPKAKKTARKPDRSK